MRTRFRCSVALLVGWLALAPLHAQVPQIINYQGRIVVGTTNFTGTGQFKFALVNATGNVTYWSNNGTSTAGSEPTAAVSLAVSNGLYSVLLGDGSVLNMIAILPSVFNNADVRLRVWFNDGVNGFQLLTPDQRIAAVGYAMTASTVPDGSITGTKIAAATITAANISTRTIAEPNLAIDSVTFNQLANGSVHSQTILDGAVTTAKLATSSVDASKLAIGSVSSSAIFAGAVLTNAIADNAVTSAKILDGTIGSADLADGSVTGVKIATATISQAQLANNAVGNAEITDLAVTNAKLSTDSVTSAKILDGSVGTADLADASVTAPKLADNAVGTAEIIDASVTAAKLASNAVTTAKVLSRAITEPLLAVNSVTYFQLADQSVHGVTLQDGAVTAPKIGILPAARVNGSTQNISSASSIVLFDSEEFDTANLHSIATNLERLVAPIDGLYQVTFTFFWGSSASVPTATFRQLSLYKQPVGGSQVLLGKDRRLPVRGVVDPSELMSQVTTLVSMRAGDYLLASATHNETGGIQPFGTGNACMQWVSAHP